MRLDQIKIDDRIYPRPQKDNDNIRSLVEKLRVGTPLDPIIVQNVTENGDTKCLSLNGVHRLVAYGEYNRLDGVQKITDIEVEHWRGESPIPFEENVDEMLIFAYQSNDQQGLNMRTMDTKHTARMLRERHPDWSEEYIGKRLNRGQPTIHEHIKDIIQRQTATEHSLVIRLSRLGWTQQEIVDHPDITVNDRSAISKIVKKIDTDKIHNLFYEANKEVDKIAEMFDIDEVTAWAILLEGKDDLERFKLFGKEEYGDGQPKIPDYWKFAKGDPRLGMASYEGNLYGQEVLNIIYRYTRQGDLVVDPMAGGGVTVDACLVMGRRCRVYDKDPGGRKDIMPWDIISEGFPPKAKRCNLIILDPPYYKKKETEYNSSEFSKDRETFIANMGKLARASYEALLPSSCVALLYGQYLNYDSELESIFSSDLCKVFEKDTRFRCILRIQSPLTFDIQYQPFAVERAKTFNPWRILPVSKDWQIFKKV